MDAYADRFIQAVSGLDVVIDNGVVRIRDERGAWLCTAKGWCEARRQLRRQVPVDDVQEGGGVPAARAALRLAVGGPVLAAGSGADRGEREARVELATRAQDAGLLPAALASLVPVRALLVLDEEYSPEAWWDIARAEARAGAVRGALREWILGTSMEPIRVPLEEAVAAMRSWATLPGWEDGPSYAPRPIRWEAPRVVYGTREEALDGWPTEALVLAARKAPNGAVWARRFSDEGVVRWTMVEPGAAEALAGLGQDVDVVRISEEVPDRA